MNKILCLILISISGTASALTYMPTGRGGFMLLPSGSRGSLAGISPVIFWGVCALFVGWFIYSMIAIEYDFELIPWIREKNQRVFRKK